MILSLASSASASSPGDMPWWAQLGIGIGLLLVGAGLREIDKRTDFGFLELAAFIIGMAGAFMIISAVI